MISTVIALRLQRAAQRLVDRLAQLETRLHDDEAAAWSEYRATAEALAVILPNIAPGRSGELLTTKQMAARLQVEAKTLLRRKARGDLRPAVVRGKFIRWRGDEVPNGNRNGNATRK